MENQCTKVIDDGVDDNNAVTFGVLLCSEKSLHFNLFNICNGCVIRSITSDFKRKN